MSAILVTRGTCARQLEDYRRAGALNFKEAMDDYLSLTVEERTEFLFYMIQGLQQHLRVGEDEEFVEIVRSNQ